MHNFNDCTFLIPYRKGNQDREDNLIEILRFLNTFISSNVVIVEQINTAQTNTDEVVKGAKFENLKIQYVKHNATGIFHKTRLYNIGLSHINTEIVIPYDVDVLIPIDQLVKAKKLIRDGVDYCYPFNGNYIEIPKSFKSRKILLENYNFETFLESVFEWEDNNKKLSKRHKIPGIVRDCPPGGCIFIKRSVYIEIGMENEDFIGYGPEDVERKWRLKVLGYKTESVNGNIYHIEHEYEKDNQRVTSNNNRQLWTRLQSMKVEAIRNLYTAKNYKEKYKISL